MPIKKKEFELDDGTKVWVRQASGIEKLKISNIQARVFREFQERGDPADWDTETNIEFSDRLDEEGGGMEAQIDNWLSPCVISDDFNVNLITSAISWRILRSIVALITRIFKNRNINCTIICKAIFIS